MTLRSGQPYRIIFLGLLVLWLIMPLLLADVAQDAVPMAVAGRLLTDRPDAIYPGPDGGIFDPQPAFADKSRQYYSGSTWRGHVVAFIASPLALPLVRALPQSPRGASMVYRELGMLAFVLGMAGLWQRLVTREPKAAEAIVYGTILLTWFVVYPMALAQTSPFMFLAVSLSPSRAGREPRAAFVFGMVMAVCIAFKAFPLLLLVVPLWHRQWRPILWTAAFVAALTALTLLVAPPQIWTAFAANSMRLAATGMDNPYNGSVDAVLNVLGFRSLALALGIRVAIVVTVGLALGKMEDPDSRWACAWSALLVLFPQVWGHYSAILFAGMATVLVARPDRRRFLWTLPVIGALLVPVALNPATSVGPVLRLTANGVGLLITLVVAMSPVRARTSLAD